MADTVDPVATPGAYQQLLLSFLGEDDPAEVQAATPAAVRALFDEAGGLLRERPEPTEWSVLECVGHLVDGELIVAARYRWIVAEDEPDIVGYDEALWVDVSATATTIRPRCSPCSRRSAGRTSTCGPACPSPTASESGVIGSAARRAMA
ncbi:MAG: DinB family protein [Candidatus Limnocylindrales bacterium]